MSRLTLACLISFFCIYSVYSENAKIINPKQKKPSYRLALGASIAAIATEEQQLKDNSGSSFLVLQTLPWLWLKQSSNLVAIDLTYQRFGSAITLNSLDSEGKNQRLININQTKLSLSYRSIYNKEFFDINFGFSVGLGITIPFSASVLSPQGKLSFSEASSAYPEANNSLSDMDKRFAFFLQLGLDQKALGDFIWWGTGFQIAMLQAPKTKQSLSVYLYVTAALW